jgi:hypothetical protein
MVKRIQSSRELNLLQYLNTPGMRYDPWNPSAPLLSIVAGEATDYIKDEDSDNESEEEEEPWAVLDPLGPYDAQPFATVEEALDFVMQLLQVSIIPFFPFHHFLHIIVKSLLLPI